MKFSYNPRIIRHLGYELITSDEIAITELIKNSYDAGATIVNIQFLDSLNNIPVSDNFVSPIPDEIFKELQAIGTEKFIVIEDNGKGMDFEVLTKGFFEVGGTLKKEEKAGLSDDDEIILGEKGIGRLAAQRISPILIVETSVLNSSKIDIIKVNWQDFIKDKENEAPEWSIKRSPGVSYTRLWLIGNPDQPLKFSNYFEKREEFDYDLFGNAGESLGIFLYAKDALHSALSFLYSPFEVNKSVLNLKLAYNGEIIKHDFNYESIKIAESIHSFDSKIIFDAENKPADIEFFLKMEIKPWFIERIHQSELGKVLYQDWRLTPTKYNDLLKKYQEYYSKNLNEKFKLSDILKKWNKKYEGKLPDNFIDAILKLAPIEGKVYSFKRDRALLSMAIASAIENKIITSNTKGVRSNFKDFLSIHNGIKLYRNSFRISTIGNQDNDWLELQQKRTTGQQFYRYELGNVIGFIKINDKKQQYIYETSSREDITDNLYAYVLQITLSEIIEIFSPGFTKRATELTKYILDLEKLIPENDNEEIESELEKSKQTLEAAKRNVLAIQHAITEIRENIDLDSPDKIGAVQKLFKQLEPTTLNFEKNIENTNRSFISANALMEVVKQQQIKIKTEAYNNYKLMANGLVTEIITHELHSLLSDSDSELQKYDLHFKNLENYFLNNELYDINRNHLLPIKDKFSHLFSRMSDLDKFYSFLEKTFLYKGNSQDLSVVSLQDELREITDRFKFRLTRHKIDIDFSMVNNMWEVPKGSLLHVFYNLIDNAIYWTKERQRLSRTNNLFKSENKDKIIIRTINPSTIQIYDTGTGVYERYQDTLFNELESGKENGRGMGLYIVRQFLKSFGGEISLIEPLNSYGHKYIFEIQMKNNLVNNA